MYYMISNINPFIDNLYIIKNFLSNAEIAHLDSKYITPNFSKFLQGVVFEISIGVPEDIDSKITCPKFSPFVGKKNKSCLLNMDVTAIFSIEPL